MRSRIDVVLFGGLVLALSYLTASTGTLRVLFPMTPAVAAIAVVFVTRAVGPAGWMSLGLSRGGYRAWPAAFAIPALALGTAIALALMVGAASNARIPAGLPIPEYLVKATAVVAVSAAFSLGEELGWRGFLTPRLAPLGRVRTGVVIGLLWGVWHIPAIGFHPTHLLACVLISFSANEVAMASGSVWPAAVLHGAHNALDRLIAGLVVGSGSLATIAGTEGFVTLAVYGVVALSIVVLRRPWSRASWGGGVPGTIDRIPTPSYLR